MRQRVYVAFALLLLSACEEKPVELPQPVAMTSQALGFYCQMDLLTHDGPKGQIHLDGMSAPLFFSQVKDAIAYIHMPEQSHAVQVAYVQDMSAAESWAKPGAWIPVQEAIYVIGSQQMGGMGAPEYVPFSSELAAKVFIDTRGGTLRRYADIRTEDVLSVTETEASTDDDADMANRLHALSPTDETN